MTPTLTLQCLTKTYAGQPALSDVSLTVAAGERVALLGHNGAGKSTMMKIILGLIPHDSGSLQVTGAAAGSPEARRNVAYLPENAAFHPALTGLAPPCPGPPGGDGAPPRIPRGPPQCGLSAGKRRLPPRPDRAGADPPLPVLALRSPVAGDGPAGARGPWPCRPPPHRHLFQGHASACGLGANPDRQAAAFGAGRTHQRA